MRLFLALLFCGSLLFAKHIEAHYTIRYGIFGKIGVATATYDANDTAYRIEVVAKATGFAKVLSGGRVERYVSWGSVVDGVLVPKEFIKTRANRNKKRVKVFRFDHKKRRIEVQKEYFKHGKLESITKPTTLPYYAKNDLLSLFFNLHKRLLTARGKLRLTAVGGDRKNGAVDIFVPEGRQKEQLRKLLQTDGIYLIATIHQKIFASKNGELYIVLGKDGLAKKAMLKDVIMFGDVIGTMVRKRESE